MLSPPQPSIPSPSSGSYESYESISSGSGPRLPAPLSPPSSEYITYLQATRELEHHRVTLDQCRRWYQYTVAIQRDVALLRSWEKESTWFLPRHSSHLRIANAELKRHRHYLRCELQKLRAGIGQLADRANDALAAVRAAQQDQH